MKCLNDRRLGRVHWRMELSKEGGQRKGWTALECLVAARPDPGPLGWAGVAFRNAKNHSHQTSPAQHS
jgi:hypothetical protein